MEPGPSQRSHRNPSKRANWGDRIRLFWRNRRAREGHLQQLPNAEGL